MLEVAAIAVRHGGEEIFAVARRLKSDLSDSRKVFADRIRIVGVRRAELVEIDLLIKIQVSIWPLALPGKSRVINAGAIGIPGSAATCGWILDMRDGIRQRFACRGFVEVKRAIFAAAGRERYRNTFGIQRR